MSDSATITVTTDTLERLKDFWVDPRAYCPAGVPTGLSSGLRDFFDQRTNSPDGIYRFSLVLPSAEVGEVPEAELSAKEKEDDMLLKRMEVRLYNPRIIMLSDLGGQGLPASEPSILVLSDSDVIAVRKEIAKSLYEAGIVRHQQVRECLASAIRTVMLGQGTSDEETNTEENDALEEAGTVSMDATGVRDPRLQSIHIFRSSFTGSIGRCTIFDPPPIGWAPPEDTIRTLTTEQIRRFVETRDAFGERHSVPQEMRVRASLAHDDDWGPLDDLGIANAVLTLHAAAAPWSERSGSAVGGASDLTIGPSSGSTGYEDIQDPSRTDLNMDLFDF